MGRERGEWGKRGREGGVGKERERERGSERERERGGSGKREGGREGDYPCYPPDMYKHSTDTRLALVPLTACSTKTSRAGSDKSRPVAQERLEL